MTYECKACGSENIIMIEYGYSHPEQYDGISEIKCNDCGKRFGRWTEKELPEGYCESRWGTYGIVKYSDDK